MTWDPVDLTYALLGLGALLAGVLPRVMERRPFSMPIVFLGIGMIVFALPTGLPRPDPRAHPELAAHLAEIVVIVALMGVGLKIDRPLGFRSWMSAWRLVLITMPLTVATVALLGWAWAGLAPAAALLFGGALAPTDPVLASDVQVGEPTDVPDSEDEVRFALTSEAGLTEGTAFPFVYLAIALVAVPAPSLEWLARWATVDMVYKGVMGILGGIAVGWALGRLFFRAHSETLRLARHSEGFLALASSLLTFGLVEVVGGYGFLGVFVAARMIRAAQRPDHFHQVLHDFSEQIERLLTVFMLVLFGGSIVAGVLAPLTWKVAAVGLALLLVVRPLIGWLTMWGAPGYREEHWVIAAFGIRGIGTLYYVAYAMSHAHFPGAELVWAGCGFVVLVSVVVHGVLGTPVMQVLDRAHRRTDGTMTGLPAPER
ncbi:sodium/proton antiporter, CPA1 family [Micromonospora pattaloongensis]|uniref:Sodium/proton antiporter, CPA1 family n=1 Tax=Micromonospora pattaloongensis TaxID=405436 RepID=A0A1H3S8N9_9ACTN|nr:cation:proton antiporter [Micromonospora pattaloongensis]SDZ33945.1 sodium/proton antiporter, CPA1 family [Micromonospora pattaloongensis]